MGSLVAHGLCCCFSCCCKECGEGCKKWLGIEKVTKIYYFLLVLVFVVPSIFIFFFLNQWQSFFEYFEEYFGCPQTSEGGQFGCIGASAIYRLSLCLLILFFLMLVFMLCRSRLSMAVNEGCFCFKYILIVGLFIGSLWISNTVFNGYGIASQYISILFMILQCIILIDLFYLAGISLVRKYDNQEGDGDGNNYRYACCLVFLTLVIEAGAVALNVLGYLIPTLTDDTNCGSTLWVNIITSIMLIVMPIIQFLHFNTQNSLLTTALVSLYISFLTFICQFSFSDNDSCNRMNIGAFVADIVISLFFFVLTMYGSIMGGTGQVRVTRNGNINQAIGVGNQNEDNQNEEKNQNKYQAAPQKSNENLEVENQEKYTQSCDWVKWHFYMCLASVYVGILITNWNSANVIALQLVSSLTGFWVRLGISWATFLLYIWTMIAPRVCPNRDFTVE